MKFLDLSHDVILLILEHCPPKSLGRLRMACKALNDLFFTPSLWKSLVISGSKAHQPFLTKLISKTKCGIRRIIASDVQVEIITEILKTNAVDIRLLNMLDFGQNQIPSKIKRLDVHLQFHASHRLNFMVGSNLTELHLLFKIVPDLLVELRNCLNLHTLTLGNCSDISNDDLLRFTRNKKKWAYLALLGARNLNDLALQQLSRLNIKHLILHSCHLITDQGISVLAGSQYLVWIKVIRCRGLSLGAFDNTHFVGTLDCVMKYSDFVDVMSSYYDPIARNNIPPSAFDNMEYSLTDGTFIKFGRPIRGAEEDKANNLAWFKSKVVSRNHAECWMKNGVVYVKDSGSSSGTFLNGMRLSPGGKLSRPYPLKDGDVIQLGVDYQGRQEDIFKAVIIKINLLSSQENTYSRPSGSTFGFRKALQSLLTASNPFSTGTHDETLTVDCCICLSGIGPFQALFLSPCSHCFHYKCVKNILSESGLMFPCPVCRQVANLEASVSMESLVETFDAESISTTEDEHQLEIATAFQIDTKSCQYTNSKGSSLFVEEGLTVTTEQNIFAKEDLNDEMIE